MPSDEKMIRYLADKCRAFAALLRDAVLGWFTHGNSTQSAALAFYSIFSLVPSLLIGLVIAGSFLDEDQLRAQIVREVATAAGTEAAAFVHNALRAAINLGTKPLASAIGAVTLVFGATAYFAQLEQALNRIWGIEPTQGRWVVALVRQRLVAFTMVVGIGLVLLLSSFLSTIVQALYGVIGGWLPIPLPILEVAYLLLVASLLALIYRYLPAHRIAWQNVWLGAVFTAVFFGFGRFLIAYYLARTPFVSTFGAAGSLVLILLWVYYSSMIVLLGAELTRAYAQSDLESSGSAPA